MEGEREAREEAQRQVALGLIVQRVREFKAGTWRPKRIAA